MGREKGRKGQRFGLKGVLGGFEEPRDSDPPARTPLLLISRSEHYHRRDLFSPRRIEELTKELEAAMSATRAAGEVLRDTFGSEQAVRYKG